MNPILEIKNLNYIYSIGTPFEHQALDNVSFAVNKGEFIGIIGHTGSGKSTLMQQLNGLLKPTSGQVLLDGVDIWSDKKLTRQARFRVGLVFQYPEYQLFEETVFRDIAYGPKNMGLTENEVKERVLETAELVGLDEEILAQSPFALSGGQKRRVAIAGVMALRPRILILDEPTAGLDPMGREDILAEIRAYHKKTGGTVLLVSHSMEDVAKCAGKILVMDHGSVFCYEDTAAVFRRVEQLEQLGLSVPQVTKICAELRKRGIPLGNDIYTVQEAVRQLAACYKAKKGGASVC